METTLSGRSSIELIRTAQRLGWKVRVFYIGLGDPVRNVQRVSSRVLDGGHAVPEADIHRRYWRSLASLPVVADLVDFLAVYDNSGRTLRRVLVIKDRVVHRRQPGSGSTWWEQALAPFLES